MEKIRDIGETQMNTLETLKPVSDFAECPDCEGLGLFGQDSDGLPLTCPYCEGNGIELEKEP
jgi:DnaJ-class molecular chaperone